MLPRSYQRRRPYRRRVARKRPRHPSRHGHAHTTRPRSRAQPPSTGPPCTHELRCQRERRRHQIATASACSAALAQTFERKITMPPQTDPRAPPCERKDRKQPAHGTVYVPPWVEMERPSQPNVAHMDAIQRQLRRKRARDPRGSPVGSTREPRHLRLPNAPSTLSDGEKQRHQPLQCPDSNRSGRQPPTHHGVATRAPPFTAQTARDRPSGSRVPRPTCHRERTAAAVLGVVPAPSLLGTGTTPRRRDTSLPWFFNGPSVNLPLDRGFGS